MVKDEKDVSRGARINLMVLVVSMPVGGVENQVLSVMKRLDPEKYNVAICCIKEPGALGEKAAVMGINTIALNMMKSSRFSPGIPYHISRILKKNDVHILWTHQYVANLYGRIAAMIAGTKGVIASFHALYDNPKRHRSIFNHLLAYWTDALVAVSGAVADDIRRHDRVNPGKIRVIHNGVELSLFEQVRDKTECRKRFGLPEEAVIIGTVGRLSKEKNQEVMIDAIRRLPDCVRGFIVGDGPRMKELREMGRDKILFPGQIALDLIPLALQAMDIFCLPSRWEGFGIACIEAMASGLPVVVSDIPSLREVVGDGGLYFRPDDAGQLADILKTLTDDSVMRAEYGKRVRERARLFSLDNTVRAYEELFEKVVRKS